MKTTAAWEGKYFPCDDSASSKYFLPFPFQIMRVENRKRSMALMRRIGIKTGANAAIGSIAVIFAPVLVGSAKTWL